ncbi:MAG: Thiol peroxidase, Bcp-type [Myxococcaceae bacterium]|nr:Thiol peroxidase, Bcp-type [Myxococcaceae bacterium]
MLEVGKKAPKSLLTDGFYSYDADKRVSAKDFAGKYLVVYFYPRDSTPGCTREAQAFHAAAKELAKLDAAVVGVSKDSVKSHCSFRDKYSLGFPLLSDPDLALHNAFGSYGEKTMYGKKIMGTIRSTFILDPEGKVVRVFPNVKVDGHVDAILDALRTLQGKPGAAKAAAAKTMVASAKPAAKKVAPKKPAAKTMVASAKPKP